MSQRAFSLEVEKKIVEEYRAGAGSIALAAKYKTSYGTVLAIIKRHGCPRRRPGRHEPSAHLLDKDPHAPTSKVTIMDAEGKVIEVRQVKMTPWAPFNTALPVSRDAKLTRALDSLKLSYAESNCRER